MDRFRRAFLQTATALALVAPFAVHAQAPASVRLRGTIQAVTDDSLTLRQRNGEITQLALSPTLTVTEMYPVAFSDVTSGSFVGIGAMPQPDGTRKAIAVVLFPESMRGTGEGDRPFDFLPQSTMTNATVSGITAASSGRQLVLTYPGGKQAITVPPDAPIVSLRPGDRSLLVPGAAVSLTAQQLMGKPTAMRITAGRDGFSPPY